MGEAQPLSTAPADQHWLGGVIDEMQVLLSGLLRAFAFRWSTRLHAGRMPDSLLAAHSMERRSWKNS